MAEYSGAGVTDLVPGSLRAFRVWALTRPSDEWAFSRGRGWQIQLSLTSVSRSYEWIPGINKAKCLRGVSLFNLDEAHDVATCTCGFYGAYKGVPSEYYSLPIWGSFRASGKVQLGTRGVRAEKVQVEALSLRPYARVTAHIPTRDMLLHLGETYEVPVFEDYNDLLDAYPPESLDNILPSLAETIRREREMAEEEMAAAAAALTAQTLGFVSLAITGFASMARQLTQSVGSLNAAIAPSLIDTRRESRAIRAFRHRQRKKRIRE